MTSVSEHYRIGPDEDYYGWRLNCNSQHTAKLFDYQKFPIIEPAKPKWVGSMHTYRKLRDALKPERAHERERAHR